MNIPEERSTSGFEIRALTPDDNPDLGALMAQAFGQGRVVTPPAPDAPPRDMTGRWGAFEKGQLRAALTILPRTVYWGEEGPTLALGAIAAVATWAEARGRGYVDALLRQSLVVMHDAGQTISALYPFAWSFYRRYGWDWVGETRSVKVPLRELRAAPEGKQVIRIPGTEAKERLTPAYARYGERYRGMFLPENHAWEGILRDDDSRTTYVYVYEPTGEYLLWRYEREDRKGTVREWVVWTPEGHRALLSLLHYLGTQCGVAQITLPSDTPLWSHLMHWDLETKIEPVFMGRVVDVAAALAALPTPAGASEGSVTLALTDAHAPWNQGTFRIAIEAGGVQATPLLGAADAGIACDIAAFSQAYWGQPALTALRRAGRIDVRDEAAFSRLSALLPASPVYTLDHF